MLKKLQEKAGYVSIETVIIAGLMLALGVTIIVALFAKGTALSDTAMADIDSAIATSALAV